MAIAAAGSRLAPGLMGVASRIRDASLVTTRFAVMVTAKDAVLQGARPLVRRSGTGCTADPQTTCINTTDMAPCTRPQPHAIASTLTIGPWPIAVIICIVVRPMQHHGASKPGKNSQSAVPDLTTRLTRLSARCAVERRPRFGKADRLQ